MDKLRVLIVEDSEADELLLIRELRRGGLHFESERVQTAEEMHRALASHPFDVILADFVLPNFGAQQALAVMKQRNKAAWRLPRIDQAMSLRGGKSA